MKTKSKEVMKRNIKNDMERSIYLQMLPFQISSFVIFILFSLSHLNTLLAARISLISLFLLYCSQKKLFHFHCISSFKYLYGLCFLDIRWWRCWISEQHSHCKISSLWHLLFGYLFAQFCSLQIVLNRYSIFWHYNLVYSINPMHFFYEIIPNWNFAHTEVYFQKTIIGIWIIFIALKRGQR